MLLDDSWAWFNQYGLSLHAPCFQQAAFTSGCFYLFIFFFGGRLYMHPWHALLKLQVKNPNFVNQLTPIEVAQIEQQKWRWSFSCPHLHHLGLSSLRDPLWQCMQQKSTQTPLQMAVMNWILNFSPSMLMVVLRFQMLNFCLNVNASADECPLPSKILENHFELEADLCCWQVFTRQVVQVDSSMMWMTKVLVLCCQLVGSLELR